MNQSNTMTTLTTPYWELTLQQGEQAGPVKLRETQGGRTYADLPYLYSLCLAEYDDVDDVPAIQVTGFQAQLTMDKHDGKTVATLDGELKFDKPVDGGAIRLKHVFVLYDDKPCFDEYLTLHNTTGRPLPLRQLRLSFQKLLGKHEWDANFMRQKLYGVPFIVGPANGVRHEYSLWDTIGRGLRLDGWTLTDGRRHLTALKHNQDFIEFAEVGSQVLWDKARGFPDVFQFGGANYWTGPHWGLDTSRSHSMDEIRRRFAAGQPIEFGLTRYCTGTGDWPAGYAAFRQEMKELGHRLPANYDPGIHIEPFYDYPWEKFTLAQLDPILRTGKEMGCETLYLDPKWNAEAASTLWDEPRLGPLPQFIDRLDKHYGLRRALGLHIMGSNYYYHDTAHSQAEMVTRAQSLYPGRKVLRVDPHGRQCWAYCYASRDWLEEKVNRLHKLCEQGLTWFMFDFQRWDGPCHAPDHGHPVPSTAEDHAHALLEVIQRVKAKYPHVQVELHDVLVAGERERRTPMYYLHGLPNSFEECWGFEYMHMPLNDLLCGDARSLYYYNLAYEIPLYAHINMTMDNENCLAFWWMASTVRHLGIGGFSDPKQIQNYRRALAEYLPVKEFFTKGEFHGLDPDCHVHTLPTKNAAVAVLFNLKTEPVQKEYTLPLAQYGLDIKRLKGLPSGNVKVANEHSLQINCHVPAMAARLLLIGV